MTPFERWSVRLSSAVVILSGFGFLWAKYLVEPTDPFAVVNHPLEPWFLKVHVVSAPLLVFALGLITVRHILQHLRRGVRAARRSGLVLIAAIPPMVLTGYLLQVVTGPGLLDVLAWTHIGSSAVFTVAVGVHLTTAARCRNGNGERPAGSSRTAQSSPPASSPAPNAANPTRLPPGSRTKISSAP